MQKILIGIMSVLTLVLALLCAVQARQLRSAREQARQAEAVQGAQAAEREEQSTRVRELERANRLLEQQVQKFATVTTQLRTNQSAQENTLRNMSERLQATRGANAGAAGESGDFGKGMGEMLGKMMKDPAMREMMRDQQKAVINMMYGGLFKELNLTTEETEKLKGLLTEAQMKNVESAQALFGNKDAVASQDAQKRIADAKTQSDAEIKELLGPERFAQYQEYQKHVGERMQIDQFKAQAAGDGQPLQDQQVAQLMQVMKDAKATMPPPIPNDQTQVPKPEQFTEENLNRQIQWMDDYNRRLVEGARPVLSPEQLKQYQAFLEQQSSMQKLGLKMARQMFGGEAPVTPVPAK